MTQVWRISGVAAFDVTTDLPAPAPLHGMGRTLEPALMPMPQSDMVADAGREVGHCLSCTVNVSSFGVRSDRKTSQASYIRACPKTGAQAWLNNDNAHGVAVAFE